jgi:hypothetical protein
MYVGYGIRVSKASQEPWEGTVDRPGCRLGSSKTDFKLMGCDPVFWVQKARHPVQWRILVDIGLSLRVL